MVEGEYYGFSNGELISELGRRFREYRLRCNLTQADVSEESGISVPIIRNFEQGKGANITLQTLLSLIRTISQLENFDLLLPELPPDLERLYKTQGKEKKRARNGRKNS